ncbi:hypothetical protein H2203_006321 [Taxawa tesnikishii (nom. ined.)]|nr:hypothetical protein H2203_006321 [Dothideales sp. JES 119]
MPAAGGITTPNAQQAPTSTGSIIAADLFTRQRQQAGARAGRLTPIPGVSASPSNAPQAASAGNSTHAQAGAAPTAISTVNDVPAAMQANATTGQGVWTRTRQRKRKFASKRKGRKGEEQRWKR